MSRIRARLMLVLAVVLAQVAPAGAVAVQVRDICTTRRPGRTANAEGFTPLGSLAVFFAIDEPHGEEMWVTDGTPAGTSLLFDFNPGKYDSIRGPVAAGNGRCFVSPRPTGHDPQLWVTDGTTAGTTRASPSSYPWPTPGSAAVLNGELYYQFLDVVGSNSDPQLWKSDGTPAGTALVKNVDPSSNIEDYQGFFVVGNRLYFISGDRATGNEPWVSDGTPAGTTLLGDIAPGATSSDPGPMTAVGSTVFFAANSGGSLGRELWKSDGTPAGTVLVRNIASPTGVWSSPTDLTDVNGILFFVADDAVSGRELWRSDGSAAGTVEVADINPGPAHSTPHSLIAGPGGILYFVANDGVHGDELWRSDGTSAGTSLVLDINPGVGSSGPKELTLGPGGLLFFTASEPATGYELWKSDGSPSGTRLVHDFNAGAGGSNLTQLTLAGTRLFLLNSGGLWVTDGTAVTALPAATSALTAFQGRVLFAETLEGGNPWCSDGTPGGTYRLRDIGGRLGSDPHEFHDHLGSLFFLADADANSGTGLWISDGSASGTRQVAGSGVPSGLTSVGQSLLFDYFTFRRELWQTDQAATGVWRFGDGSSLLSWRGGAFFERAGDLWRTSPAGTSQLTPGFTPFYQLADLGTTAVFRCESAAAGDELCRSDGTTGGSGLLIDIHPGPDDGSPSELTVVGSHVFFGAWDGSNDQLWMSDGTTAGTRTVKSLGPCFVNPEALMAVGGRLLFFQDDCVHGTELWSSDGTVAATALVKDIRVGPDDSWNRIRWEEMPYGVAAGGIAYFQADNGVSGEELWRSDGTEAGTWMVKDIWPGPNGSCASRFFVLPDGRVMFAASDGLHGLEPWITDGTSSGTTLYQDIAPGPYSSSPAELTLVSGSIYFSADDGSGREPWKIDLPAAPGAPDGTFVPGTPLLAIKTAGGQVRLSWGIPCSLASLDYAVYEGAIGAPRSHASRLCSTGGLAEATLAPASGASYYLVVPQANGREGSYGRTLDAGEVPQGANACAIQTVSRCP